MTRLALYTLLLVFGSLALSAIASSFGYGLTSIALGLPALVTTGWATFGHLMTLDDDEPGGFSNQDGDRSVLYRSLGELAVKALLFLASYWVVFHWPVRVGA